MYWLVRAAPGHMLRLQNGRFDAPDRLFASIQVRAQRGHAAACCLSSTWRQAKPSGSAAALAPTSPAAARRGLHKASATMQCLQMAHAPLSTHLGR